MKLISIESFGAHPDRADNYLEIQAALNAVCAEGGVLMVGPGRYRCSRLLMADFLDHPVSVSGMGPSVSRIVGGGLWLSVRQPGLQQLNAIEVLGISFTAGSTGDTGLSIVVGRTGDINDHYRPSVNISNVWVESGEACYWANGIYLHNTWNVTMDNCYISGGSKGGNWGAMEGNGIELSGCCVNCHFSNVRCNFWATGFRYNAGSGRNAEGFFFANCSMVAVQRGVWITGNPADTVAPRMSTLTWTGGLIECRVGGVTTGSAAFHLVHVWTVLISAMQMITEALPTTHTTYAVFADNVTGLCMNACDFNAWHYGVFAVGTHERFKLDGNTATNCEQVYQLN